MKTTCIALWTAVALLGNLGNSAIVKGEEEPINEPGWEKKIMIPSMDEVSKYWELSRKYRTGDSVEKDPVLEYHYFVGVLVALARQHPNAPRDTSEYFTNIRWKNAFHHIRKIVIRSENGNPYAQLELANAYKNGGITGQKFFEDKKKSDELKNSAREILLKRTEEDDGRAAYVLSTLMNERASLNECVHKLELLLKASYLKSGPAQAELGRFIMNVRENKDESGMPLEALNLVYGKRKSHFPTLHEDRAGFMEFLEKESYKWIYSATMIMVSHEIVEDPESDHFPLIGNTFPWDLEDPSELLSMHYENGWGVEKDLKKALMWLRYSAYVKHSVSVSEYLSTKKARETFKNVEQTLPGPKDGEYTVELLPIPADARVVK